MGVLYPGRSLTLHDVKFDLGAGLLLSTAAGTQPSSVCRGPWGKIMMAFSDFYSG